MDFSEAQAWLERLPEPQKWDLRRMRAMTQDAKVEIAQIRAVQVAGTNGKGSTCAFLDSILRQAGIRTGLYTSPHLMDVRERIQVDGKMISEDDFAALATFAKPFVEEHGASHFETLTLMAFKHFQDQDVALAVVEVGLGGSKDATSILHPRLAIITKVGMDHMDRLGRTLNAIATEKASIIPENGVVLTGAEGVGLETIELVAKHRRARLEKIAHLNVVKENPLTLEWKGMEIQPSLQGNFQAQNAALAVAAAMELTKQGTAISDMAIREGIRNATWPGRMQTIGNVVVDGAHNPDGVRALVQALQKAHPGTRWNLVFGVLADKDYAGMADELKELSLDQAYLVTPKSPRALPAEKLKAVMEKQEVAADVRLAPSVADALVNLDGKPALVCGSLYVAAEALRKLQRA